MPSLCPRVRPPQAGDHVEMVSGEGVVEKEFEHPGQGGTDSGMGKLLLALGLPAWGLLGMDDLQRVEASQVRWGKQGVDDLRWAEEKELLVA